jgi:Tol biopolymer transport system component
MRALLLIALIAQAQAPAAPPPSTDIYLLSMTSGLPSLKSAKPSVVSTVPGYDNQPMFSPDGSRILFAANHDGKQFDVYAFDRATGRMSQLTRTEENENSPTVLPAGLGEAGSFSVVQSELPAAPGAARVQRLWRFTGQGQSPQLILKDIQPVGYHAWLDADKVALFVLGQPNTLQLASVQTGKGEVLTRAIGRSLHRVPGTRRVSFVQRDGESGPYLIKEIDIDSRKVDTLTTFVEGSPERDYAWMPDGKTLLMSAGTKVFSWIRGGQAPVVVFDAADHALGAVTRMAVSPKGDAVAIVVAEPSTRQ